MACTTEQIKKDSFNLVKGIIEGKSTSIRIDDSGKITFNYTKSNFYKDKAQAFNVAQSKLKAVEKWAANTFGEKYSKGWIEIYQTENEVTGQYTFPSNLEQVYKAKELLENEETKQVKLESLQQQLEALTQGNEDVQNTYRDLYGYSYNSIDEMVQGIVSEIADLEEFDNMPSSVVPSLIAPNYNAYFDKKSELLIRVKKTIDRLYTEKRIDNTKGITKRITQLTAMKDNLEKELDDYTKSQDKFTQVKNFFTKDISLIGELLSNPTLDNLFLAQDIFRFISESADINNVNNKIFKSEANKIYEAEVKDLLETLNVKIPFIQKEINDALDIEFGNLLETYQTNLEKLYPGKDLDEIKDLLLQNLQDINSVESKFMTVDSNLMSEADVLGQLLRVEYTRVNEKEKSRTQKLIQAIDGAIPTIEKELKRLNYVFHTKAGNFFNYNWLYQNNEKGEIDSDLSLIGKYASTWNKFIYNLNKDYNKKIFEARQSRDWATLETTLTNKYNDLNDKVNFTDFTLLHDIFTSAEYDEFKKGTPSEAATYKQNLIAEIGQEEYEDLIVRQRDYLDAFLEEREFLIQSRLTQENVGTINDLSDQVKTNLEITIARLNPVSFIEAHLAGNKSMIEYTIGTQSNEKPSYIKYNTYTPKVKSASGIDTGFFDSRFKNIEANPELYKFWKIVRESTKTINENLIDSNLNLNKNSILLFKKSFRETLMDKNYLEIVKAGLGGLINIKQFFKNQMSGKDIDRTDTGDIVLPQNLNSFQAAVTENFKLFKTDLSNLLGKQIKSNTEIQWDALSKNTQKQFLNLVGLDNELDFIQDIAMSKGKFKVYALKLYSQRQVFEQQTLNLPSMLKAQLELSAEHKSRSTAKNRLDVILQKSRQVLSRKNRRESSENDRNTYWGKDRVNANKRNDFFFKQVVLNDKKDPTWGNISNELKKLSSTNDGKILGKFFYKNYTAEEKKIYYSAMKRLDTIDQELQKDLSDAMIKSLLSEKAELESRLRILGKDYLGSAIFNAAFNKLAVLVNMGFAIPVAINNYANGHMMLFSRDGEFWSKGNINLAWHYVTQNKLRFVNPSYKESWNMMGAFIKQLNIIQDGTNELQRAEDNTSFLQKGLLHPMYGTELVEWYNQVPGILSMAMDIEIAPGVPLFDGKTFPAHKLVNGVFTLKDEYRTEENIKHYEEINSDKMLEWKLLVNDMIRSLNGDYSKTGVTRIKGGVIGKQIMQFKTWLPRYISSRFAYKQKNLITGQEETGYLISSLTNPKTALASGLMTVATLAVGAMSGPSVVFMLPLIAPAIGVAVALNLIKRNKLQIDLSEVINIRSQLAYVAKSITLGTLETPVNLIGGAFGKKNLLDMDNSFRGKLSEQEAKDLKLLAKHMQFSIGILLLRLIVQSMLGDNDEEELKGEEGSVQRERWTKQQLKKAEDTKTYNLMENFLTARFQELNLANDPISLFSTMGSKNGLENNIGKLSKAFYNTANGFFFPEDDIITQGDKAGQSKSGNTWRKLLLPSPIRGIGQDTWQVGFESWTEKEWQNNDFTDKVFDSDYKIDKKELKGKQKAKKQELLEEFEQEEGVKFKELSPEEQDKVEKKIAKEAKKEVPNLDRELYDEEQQLIEE